MYNIVESTVLEVNVQWTVYKGHNHIFTKHDQDGCIVYIQAEYGCDIYIYCKPVIFASAYFLV